MPDSKNKKFAKILLSIFLIMVIIAVVRKWAIRKEIRENPHEVVCARITDTYFKRQIIYCYLKFKYANKEFYFPDKFYLELGISEKTYHDFENGRPNFLIVFPKGKPNDLQLLQSDEDFKDLNFSTTDTTGVITN